MQMEIFKTSLFSIIDLIQTVKIARYMNINGEK